MGRKRVEVDPRRLSDLASQGKTQVEIAKQFGVSHVTLAKRIGELRAKHGVLSKYRSVQSLELTELQVRVLEAITPEKIYSASLLELVRAFAVLKKMELLIEGKPVKITGLIAYLEILEKEEKEKKQEAESGSQPDSKF
ncbi:MAG: hypothetical protein ACLQJ7_00335 [Syntrophobacteraceae bacterium]